jgi:hypothetical protein
MDLLFKRLCRSVLLSAAKAPLVSNLPCVTIFEWFLGIRGKLRLQTGNWGVNSEDAK